MALVLNATPGSEDANTYVTLAEANAYFESRAPLSAWDTAPSQEALLVMATRLIDAMFSGARVFMKDEDPPYIITSPKWTGVATDPAVQALAWPRTGMLNRNGYPIDPAAIPRDLKYATAELAGQLAVVDRTLDNDISVQGITGVTAGSVSVQFKNAGIAVTKMIPDAVMTLLVPSWITEESIDYMQEIDFEVF